MTDLLDKAYACRYRNVDSTETYSRRVLGMAACREAHKAEALNHLAFVSITHMDYGLARRQLDSIAGITDNQLELLVSYVQQMRLCQRRSENRQFYEYREKAITALKRIDEERFQLSDRQWRRLTYAESELAIVNSTYYYYVGLERQSVEALASIDADAIRRDTAQYLNYLYNIGAGGILNEGTPEQIYEEEMDYLDRCLSIAQRHHYPYFEAQAREAQADHTGDVALAEEALALFRDFGDVYQTAGAYRTLASCYHAQGDDLHALENLQLALSDSTISQAPDLVASIREQLSVVYAAVNDKQQSDQNRNLYLDLQEQTRQDRELEARAAMLDTAVSQLNWMILAVVLAIALLLILLWFFNRMRQKRKDDHRLADLLEQKEEEVAEARLRVEKNERRHLEQRTKISLAMSILPLIDRILYAVGHLPQDTEHPAAPEDAAKHGARSAMSNAQLDYIRELIDSIEQQNDLLTQWIQLRQGELSLHIETFLLQPLFDIVGRSRRAFEMAGIDLEVAPTALSVKADRVLTLFMLNTLADNARKFTPRGGRVSIAATELADAVEVSISDTGQGMSPDELAHVFDHQVSGNHGFGLMNCRGIIEKYRKLSQLFRVCLLQAESAEGRGSRFFFRLPKGVLRCWLAGVGLWCCGLGLSAAGQSSPAVAPQPLSRAHIYADSAYFSNINGTYRRTLAFADSCRECLNAHYLEQHPGSTLLMTQQGGDRAVPAEIQWLHDSVDTNYQIILDIRNESAVAALALHEWQLYEYNNKVYTQLFKELSADNTLADYCRTMQQSRQNKRVAVVLLLLLLAMIVPAYYMLYYRHRLYDRYLRERVQQDRLEMADDELRRAELEDANLHVANSVLDNCLSTLKHETMYYPSRIRQLADAGDVASLAEVTRYYRDLYAVLIQQSISQLERIHLHVHPVELYGCRVLGDANLLRYLFELLLGESGRRSELRATLQGEVRDDKYVVYRIPLAAPLSPLTSLLCRQIVRDHGEATSLRGCGITEEAGSAAVVLPRAIRRGGSDEMT